MAALANEYSPKARVSGSRVMDTSVLFSQLFKFLRDEDALSSVQQPVNSLLLSCLCTSSRQNFPLANASGFLSSGPMMSKAYWKTRTS